MSHTELNITFVKIVHKLHHVVFGVTGRRSILSFMYEDVLQLDIKSDFQFDERLLSRSDCTSIYSVPQLLQHIDINTHTLWVVLFLQINGISGRFVKGCIKIADPVLFM